MEKSMKRRPSTRNSNQRVRSVSVSGTNLNGQQIRSNNMIVTMSMEQNVASATGAGRIAASRTRKISRTSTVFDPSGIAIEVVCGSSVENHEEVVVDLVPNVRTSKRELSSGRTAGTLKRSRELIKAPNTLLAQKANQRVKALHTTELRAKLNFLQEEQYENFLQYNVQQPKDILNLTLLQLISTGIRMDQLERIIAMVNDLTDLNKLLLMPEQQSQTGAKGKANATCVPEQSTVEKLGENLDDDDDNPLVIDEGSVDEQSNCTNSMLACKRLRCVEDIEKSLAVVRHVKIPKSLATISEIRTELSHIVADLNANEAQIVHGMQDNREVVQNGKAVTTTAMTANPEPIITNSKPLKSRGVRVKTNVESIKPAKWARNARKSAGRSLKTKSNTTLPSPSTASNIKQQTKNGSQSTVQPQFVHTYPEGLTAECSKKKLHSVSASPMNLENFDIAHAQTNSEILPHVIDSTKPTIDVFILASKDINAPHDLVKSCDAESVVANKNLAKEDAVPLVVFWNHATSLPQASGAPYLNQDSTVTQGDPTANVDLVKTDMSYVNEAGTSITTSEKQVLPVDFSNYANLLSTTVASSHKACTKDNALLQSNVDENPSDKNNTTTSPTKTTNTKIKESTRITTCKDSQNLESLSAALARGELQLKQPTVLLTKLNPYSFPLAALKQGSKVDADSTTETFVGVSTRSTNGQEHDQQKNEMEQADETVVKFKNMERLSSMDTCSGQRIDKNEFQEIRQVQYEAGFILPNNSSNHEKESSTSESLKWVTAFNQSKELENKPINVIQSPQKQKPKKAGNRHPKPNMHKKEKQAIKVVQDLDTNCNISHSVQDVSQDNDVSVGATLCVACTPDKISEEPDTEHSVTEISNICDINSKPLQEALCNSYDNLFEACNNLKANDKELAVKESASLKEQPLAIESPKYDCNEVDVVVGIASPPLSPISDEIASPTNRTAILNDYTPAMEIDGQCIHPPLLYILHEIDGTNMEVNKPAGLDALLCSSTPDPRLEKYNKKAQLDVQLPLSCVSDTAIQHDPRQHNSAYHNDPYTPQPSPQQTPNMLLYACLHQSPWYQSLMSTMKIQINQAISVLVRAINNFQKIRLEMPYAVFDIFKLYCAGELLEILDNLGLYVDVNGVIMKRKNLTSPNTHSYGGSTLVNATYSFIQPMMATPSNTPPTRLNTSHTTAPFVSCYVESPPVPVNTPPPSVQRHHCGGLKAPYIPRSSNKSPVAPVARQLRYEECWDLDERVSTQENNNGYSRHHTSRAYSRSERSREHHVGRTFGYRKRY